MKQISNCFNYCFNVRSIRSSWSSCRKYNNSACKKYILCLTSFKINLKKIIRLDFCSVLKWNWNWFVHMHSVSHWTIYPTFFSYFAELLEVLGCIVFFVSSLQFQIFLRLNKCMPTTVVANRDLISGSMYFHWI